ncbi:MAG TPA: hypothetical protein VEC36_11365, partial [Patescibacteria group bacterium]|nr:hypothetical protein [Patescibacteria group bacterium]
MKKNILFEGICRKKAITLAISLFFAFSGATAQTWTKLNYPERYVNKIFIPGNSANTIVVAGDNLPPIYEEYSFGSIMYYTGAGLSRGYRISNDMGQTFSDVRLDTFSIRDFLQLPSNPNTWLAATARFENEGGILVSTDAGQTWDVTERCPNNAFIRLQSGGNRVYAIAANKSSSLRSSQSIFTDDCSSGPGESVNALARDISVSPIDPSRVFIADQFSGVRISSDSGKTFTVNTNGLENLRVLSVLASRHNANIVYAGTDSIISITASKGYGIYKSLDTGRTWRKVGAPNARIWAIAEHPTNQYYLAAAGDSTGVWVSGSQGENWENHSSGIPANSKVRTITIPNLSGNENGIRIIAGVQDSAHGGVYMSSAITTSVEEIMGRLPQLSINRVFPQPMSNTAEVSWNMPIGADAIIEVSDITGRKVFQSKRFYSQGEQRIE